MRSPDIEQNTPQAPSVFVVRLEGEFDLSERERLTDAFSIAQQAAVVVIDLARTRYMDSTVLQCLVALQLVTKERGTELILVGVQPSLLRLFELTKLADVFDIRKSAKDVVASTPSQIRRLTIESRPIAQA